LISWCTKKYDGDAGESAFGQMIVVVSVENETKRHHQKIDFKIKETVRERRRSKKQKIMSKKSKTMQYLC
jgi:hypothetical protein